MKNHLLRIALAIELAWIAGGSMAIFQLPAAYRWRGYWAIGGEWLLILLAAAVGGWIGWGIIKPEKTKRPIRTSNCGQAKGCEETKHLAS